MDQGNWWARPLWTAICSRNVVRARCAGADGPAPEDYLYLPVSVGSTVTVSTMTSSFLAQAATAAAIARTRMIRPLFDILYSIFLGVLRTRLRGPAPDMTLGPYLSGQGQAYPKKSAIDTCAGSSPEPVVFLHQHAACDQPEKEPLRRASELLPCTRVAFDPVGFEELHNARGRLPEGNRLGCQGDHDLPGQRCHPGHPGQGEVVA